MSPAVADYVACVRAQGASLGSERSSKLSAEVGAVGVKAGGASEVSDELSKRYATSDENVGSIIQTCNRIANASAPAAAKQVEPAKEASPAPKRACGDFTGTWVRPDGFTFVMSQTGCSITGMDPRHPGGSSHELRGEAVGNSIKSGVVYRTDTQDCLSRLYVTIELDPSGSSYVQDTTGSDGKCGLPPGITERFVYKKQ